MKNSIAATNQKQIKNLERPFTELFSLLKDYKKTSQDVPVLSYRGKDLRAIHQHVDNTIDILLLGLQGVGFLLGAAKPAVRADEALDYLGFFISAISNLTYALLDLKSDAHHTLKNTKHKIINV